VGRHHVALVADHAQHHHSRGKLGRHNNRHIANVGAQPPVVFLINFLVLGEVLLV
jgi:hypothetical protein